MSAGETHSDAWALCFLVRWDAALKKQDFM